MAKDEDPHEETLQAALNYSANRSRGRAAEHREIILVLSQERITQCEISAFLKKRGIRIHQTTISYYLRKHPPTDAEVARIKGMLAAQPAMRRDQEPGQEVRQPPAPHKSSQQDVETPEDVARRKRREELLARARERRRPEPEEEDTTDYSFLKVQGRPFRIKPDA